MNKRTDSDGSGGAPGRKFKSFRELAEYMKGLAYEEADREADDRRQPPENATGKGGFGSFRELGEYMKTGQEGNTSERQNAEKSYSPQVMMSRHGFASPTSAGANMVQVSASNEVDATASNGEGPIKHFGKDVGKKVFKATLKNESKVPIPYLPEEGTKIKYCEEGHTCIIDGIYAPHGNKGKKVIIKVPNTCGAVVHDDGKVDIGGWACGYENEADGLKPEVIDRKTLENNKEFKAWPNPFTGKDWPEERWTDESSEYESVG